MTLTEMIQRRSDLMDAITSGTKSFFSGGERQEYQSVADMSTALNILDREIAIASGQRTRQGRRARPFRMGLSCRTTS